MISHRQLVHALCLFKHGNFTRAAIEANISQSAFSRSIQNLEVDLGIPLFDRDTTTVIPTRYGETFLHRAAAIVAGAEELEREMHLMRGLETGRFSVALGMYPAEVSGNRALASMVSKFPNLQYQALTGDWQAVNEYVSSRAVDLGFAALEVAENEDHLSVEKVSAHQMVIYCHQQHPLANIVKPSRHELDQFPLITVRVPSQIADRVPGKATIDQSSGHLVPSVEVDNFTTARELIAQSDGIGAAIPLQIESELKSGEFVLLNFQNPWIAPVHGFIFLKNRSMSPATEIYIETVREYEREADEKNKVLLDMYLR
ncbi:MAG: DNA-binding transcriptional LysR family regulator [Porticoccus sp.]|jgi:DNA-binding transcriptional LysR family regulator